LTKTEAIELARREAEARGHSTKELPRVNASLHDGVWRVWFWADRSERATGGDGFVVEIDDESKEFRKIQWYQ
jgi:hypothetical protein